MKYPLRKGWIPSRRNYPFHPVDPNDVSIEDYETDQMDTDQLAAEYEVYKFFAAIKSRTHYDKEAERERRGYQEDAEFGKYSGA